MSCLPLCAGEEAHSQAYYIIKAAQERQELTEHVPHWQAACASSPPGSLCLQPAHAASPAQSLFYEVAGGPAVRVPGSRAQHAVWPLAYYANFCPALPCPTLPCRLRACEPRLRRQSSSAGPWRRRCGGWWGPTPTCTPTSSAAAAAVLELGWLAF